MDVSKPNASKIKSTFIMLAGAFLGAMVSEGVMGVIHKGTTSADPSEIKKDATMKLVKRGVITAGSGYGAASVKGTDTTSDLLKGALTGMAVQQGTKLVSEAVKSTPALSNAAAKTSFTKNMVGLGCACQPLPTINRPARVRALRNPAYVMASLNGTGNVFNDAISKNAQLVGNYAM